MLRFLDLSKCISCNGYNFHTARILIFFINLSKFILWFINPHNNIQSNNYICAVFLNCFCIVSHFSQNSNTIHGIYTFLIQVHISAPMYRSRSGKKEISLKKIISSDFCILQQQLFFFGGNKTSKKVLVF